MAATAFSADKFALAYPPGIENHYWTKGRVSILMHTIKKNKLGQKKILEIGCGKGLVVEALRKFQINCWGADLADVDPIESVRLVVKTKCDATKLDKNFRDSIEVILLLDVIEHIPDTNNFLNELKRAFMNCSHFIITVPARKELWSNYDEFYGHFRRYDLSMTSAIASTHDFKQLTNNYFFTSLYFAGLMSVKLTKRRNVGIKAPDGWMKKAHRLMAAFLYAEYLILPGSIPGSSIIAVYSR